MAVGLCASDVGMYLRTTQRRRKDGSVGPVRAAGAQPAGGRGHAGGGAASTSAARTSSTSTGCGGWRRRSPGSPTVRRTGRRAAGAARASFEVDRSSRPLGGGVAAGRVVARARGRDGARQGARRAAVHDRCRAGAVRAGRQPGARSVLEAGRRRVGRPRMPRSRAWRRWTRTRPTGRWTCWSRPTPRAEVQEAVFFACADLLNLEVDLLFFDTTSTYFERDEPEQAAARAGVPRATGTPRTTGRICRRS